jgi:hypothetical protein
VLLAGCIFPARVEELLVVVRVELDPELLLQL